MKNLTLLAVDDDDLILQSLKIGLPSHWRLYPVKDPADVPEKGAYSAAVVDMHLSGDTRRAEGLDVIKKLKECFPYLEIVAMSGDLDRDLMEKCLRAGASRYIAKPLNLDELVLILDKIEALLLFREAAHRHSGVTLTWVGSCAASENIRRQMALMKAENGPILIEGESGTGKEIVVQLLNGQEGRPMISINVAAIPDNLFESELFGHVRGAFTGADQNKIGLAEAAHNGDLFLDEIEALSPQAQAKLLRFLESGEVRRVGAKDAIRVDTRIIAATNRSLEQLVKEGKFREDLLYRFSGKRIVLPPLRDRPEDIAELAEYFLKLEKTRRKELSSDAVQTMREYAWPGNVRELRRVCEQLALISPLPVIRRKEVLQIIGPKWHSPVNEDIDFSKGLERLVAEYEAQALTACLKKYNDIDEVARVLNISRSSLYKKIKDYHIEWR